MEYNMKIKVTILILILFFWNLQLVSAEENEYGIVKAWFNEKNATSETIEGIKLRIGEPVEIKVEVISKINGNVHVKLSEPGTTTSFEVISGPSKQDDRIDNMGVSPNWSNTFQWKIRPNGAWTNGNSPINIFVSFYNSKKKDQKPIEFTIANPYILDEQYTGAAATTPAPEITGTGAPAKPTPFPSLVFALATLLAISHWRRR
ncbi:MAG: sarcinarray family MAST domain-containing protein [Candidatus Methanoperedens sp.]|nr:MAG: sarcinarray family MAST domain-containing protein [Candidatus Methanoperedens sp.]